CVTVPLHLQPPRPTLFPYTTLFRSLKWLQVYPQPLDGMDQENETFLDFKTDKEEHDGSSRTRGNPWAHSTGHSERAASTRARINRGPPKMHSSRAGGQAIQSLTPGN